MAVRLRRCLRGQRAKGKNLSEVIGAWDYQVFVYNDIGLSKIFAVLASCTNPLRLSLLCNTKLAKLFLHLSPPWGYRCGGRLFYTPFAPLGL